jgi:hypothetical protein
MTQMSGHAAHRAVVTDNEKPAPRSWELYAHKTDRALVYQHIGSLRHVGFHGNRHEIVAVTVIEDPTGPFRGWIPVVREDTPMPALHPGVPVSIQEHDFFILAFTEAPEIQQAAGKGEIVQLRVEERS